MNFVIDVIEIWTLNFEIDFWTWILNLNFEIEFWNLILKFNSEI